MADVDYNYTNEKSIEPDLICSICHSPFTDPYCTQCIHVYCRGCITNWLGANDRCPLCSRQPTKTSDLVEVRSIADRINRLLVTCRKCGQSEIRRNQFDNHKNNHCSGITLYSSQVNQSNSFDEENNAGFAVPIMSPSGSLVNQLISEVRQLKDDLQSQKRLVTQQNEQLINFTKTTNDKLKDQQKEMHILKQSNIKVQTKLEEFDDIIQIQQQIIDEQKQLLIQLQTSSEHLDNRIQHRKDESIEQKTQMNIVLNKLKKVLPHENVNLEKYILDHCQLGSEVILSNEDLIDRDMEIVVQRAILNRQCSILNLKQNKLTYRGISILTKTFHQTIRLHQLDLSYNHLGDRGIQYLADGLLANKTIRELNLTSTDLTKQGMIDLTRMLEVNQTLTILYLNENDIDDDGMKFLTKVLLPQSNETLQALSLHSNQLITDQCVHSIMEMFKRTQTLTRIDLHQCKFSQGAKTRLRDAAENASISICI